MSNQLIRDQLNKSWLKFIVVFVLAIISAMVFYLAQREKGKVTLEEELITPKDKLIKEQVGELSELRGSQEPYSKKEIEKQIGELQKLRQQSNAKLLSEEDIQKQIEELNKQRSQ